MPFTVDELGRTNLFIWAKDWTGVTENGNTTPDWWFYEYFGTTALSDTNLDSQGYDTLLYDFQNNIDPNPIGFTLAPTNTSFGSSGAWVQLNVYQGIPSYVAVAVDDTNYLDDASWQSFGGTNVRVNLGGTEGWHSVWIGLRGRVPSETPVWKWIRLKLDLTPPQITVTGPSNTVFQPLVQLKGYCQKSLSQMSCDISNAAGVFANQPVQILEQYFDTNTWEFTTNTFQVFDIGLTPGANAFTLHATDLLGNTASTNYSITLISNNVAPVITLAWPQDGMQLCGSNFTVTGIMDNPSALISATVVTTNGTTNTYAGAVERTGQFWLNNLALTGGTNSLILTAVDIWGNTVTTNFSVSQSAAGLTVDYADPDQTIGLGGYAWGYIDDTSAAVWVNGVQGTNYGDGSWEAFGVPITPGGTASFRVSAYPAVDTPSPNTNYPTANPSDPGAYNMATDVVKPPRLYLYQYAYSNTVVSYDSYLIYGLPKLTSIVDQTEYWHDGAGGNGQQHSYGSNFEIDPFFGPSGYFTIVAVSTNVSVTTQTWPVTFDPYYPYAAGTASNYWFDGVTLNGAPSSSGSGSNPTSPSPPSITWQHVDVTTRESGTDDADTWQETDHTNAQAVIKLFTGGQEFPGEQTLWAIYGWATIYNDQFPGGSNAPPQSITMGDVGQLGSDGIRWTMLESGITKTITPNALGNNVSFGADKANYPLVITANDIPLQPQTVVSNANFCVGQNISFALTGAPIGATVSNIQWTLDGTFVNETNQPYPNGSVNYTNDPTLLTNPVITNCWWVSGGFPPANYTASVTYTLVFLNGHPPIQMTNFGLFTMAQPLPHAIAQIRGQVAVDTNYYVGGNQAAGTNLHLGVNSDSSNVGIAFGYTDAPLMPNSTNTYGQYFITQVVQFYSQKYNLYDTNGVCANGYVTNYYMGLDSSNFYGPPSRLTTAGWSDGPSAALSSAHWLWLTNTFTTWLMFQPDPTSGSIPVPMYSFHWYWAGSATNGPWGEKSGAAGTEAPSPTTQFPYWTNIIKGYDTFPQHMMQTNCFDEN
jgi:hypothetical protein